MLTMFLTGDQEQAEKELDCYGYCLERAITCHMQGDFSGAQMWHENINRSLRELEKMKLNKQEMEHIAEQMEVHNISIEEAFNGHEKTKLD